jgi:hypothetical protein
MTQTNSSFVFFSFFSLIMLFSACQKEESSPMTEEEAVEIVEASLQKNTGGLAKTTEDFTEELVTDTVNNSCGTAHQDNFTFNYDNFNIEADYAVNWSYNITCNAFNIPESAALTVSSTGTYTTLRMNSADNLSASLNITGMEWTAANVVFNGSFGRSGTQQITTNLSNRSLSSDIAITLNNINVSKSSYTIQSGSATVSLSGSDQGVPFSYNGVIVFNGSDDATLTMNGNNYNIALSQ